MQVESSKYFFDYLTIICFESSSLKWQPEIEKMHKFIAKNYKKSFENERKIERRSLLAERNTFEKLSARRAALKIILLSAERERKQIFWAH